MRFTTLRFLFVVLILSLPSPVPAAEPKQEFEQLFEKLFQAAEEKGHSRNEIINVFKDLRDTQYQLLQAKTQTKLEALLSQDTLYIGPLSTMDDEYRSLSRQQLQSQATTIASSLLDAHAESKDGVMKTLRDLRKKFGVNNEFGHAVANRFTPSKFNSSNYQPWPNCLISGSKKRGEYEHSMRPSIGSRQRRKSYKPCSSWIA